jgi:branched-subunit amino acid aminotransferase/4-amino-4-deoxychorismate lyase
MIVNLNGRIVPAAEAHLPLDDSAVLFGDSLFETMKAVAGVVEFEREHLDRLELSAGLLAFPFDRPQVEQALRDTVSRLSDPVARLRLTITRGSLPGLLLPARQPGTFFISARPYPPPGADQAERGADCLFAPNRRVNPLSHLPQMKRGNYADCLYAADFARRRGAREALFVSDDGLLLEGATSNIFLLHRDTLVTPPAGELVLPGIMRRQVLAAAARLGIAALEREVHSAELFQAQEAFLSNSLIGLLPIASIEQRPLRRGTLAERLLAEIHAAAPRLSGQTQESP